MVPNLSYAEEGVFFKIDQAKKLLADLQYYKEDSKAKQTLISLLRVEVSNDEKIIDKQKTMISLLEDNTADLQRQSANFKLLYEEENGKVQKLIKDQPSRMTWFSYGAGSAGTVFLLLAIALL